MRIVININCEHEAFMHDPMGELERIFRDLADDDRGYLRSRLADREGIIGIRNEKGDRIGQLTVLNEVDGVSFGRI